MSDTVPGGTGPSGTPLVAGSRDAWTYNLPFLWLICLVAAMGGLLFGYDWVVIGGAKPFYEPHFGIAGDSLDGAFWRGFAMSAALVGCVFGAMICGALSDTLGRKRLLIVAGLLFTISAVWTALSTNFVSFNAGPFSRRLGDRFGVEPLAHVYRRDLAGEDAGQVCLHQPVDHRHRHSRRHRSPTC